MSNSTIIMSTEHRAQSTEHRAQSQPVVSFCIPVYNNAEAAVKIVQGLLISEDSRFEVIACDDASTDNAQELLSRINDPRFRYIRNAQNLGAHKNWLKSLELGGGEWLYLVMGRDGMHGEHITRLIELLDYARDNGITLLNDGYSGKDEPVIYSGIDAMIHFVEAYHPTAAIFPRKLFEAVPDKEYYFTHSDMYPENYIRRDLLLKGKGASIMSGVFVFPSLLIDYTKKKSTVEHGRNPYDMYYAPRRRTAQYLEIIDLIDSLKPGTFSASDMNKFFKHKFWSILASVSWGWRSACSNYEWQSHYGQKVRHVGRLEMLRNIFTAYRTVKAHLKARGTYTVGRQLIMYVCMAKRLVYMPAKSAAKKILEPLGIWKVLKLIKHHIKKSPA